MVFKMNNVFDLHYDAGHSWLKVPLKLLTKLKLNNKISECSYKRGSNAFLECDCDMPLFIEALKSIGSDLSFNDINNGDNSPIRTYRRFN